MPNMASSEETVILVTGANSGLGYETLKLLMQSDLVYYIYLGCLSAYEGQEAVARLTEQIPASRSKLEVLQIDISNDNSIAQCRQTITGEKGRLDVLINNAGLTLNSDSDERMRQAWTKCYDVNVCGTYILTQYLAPLLLQSREPRLLFITSGLSSLQSMARSYTPINRVVPAGWPKPDLHPYRAYRSSKAALNMVMLEWYWMMREDGVRTWAISPGFLSTALTDGFVGTPGAPSPEHPSVGARLIVDVVEGLRDDDVGKVVVKSGTQLF